MIRNLLGACAFAGTAIVVFTNTGQALALLGLQLSQAEASLLLLDSAFLVGAYALGKIASTPKPHL